MTDYVLTGLVKSRAEMIAEAKATDDRLRQLLADIEHVDGAIRLYDPAHRPRKLVLRRSRGAEIARVVLNVLHTAEEPMKLRTLTLAVMQANRQDHADEKLVRETIEKVRVALIRQRRSGVIRSEERVGKGLLWEVAR